MCSSLRTLLDRWQRKCVRLVLPGATSAAVRALKFAGWAAKSWAQPSEYTWSPAEVFRPAFFCFAGELTDLARSELVNIWGSGLRTALSRSLAGLPGHSQV